MKASHCVLLALVALLAFASCVRALEEQKEDVVGSEADVAARRLKVANEAAARRAAISPEDLARGIAENTLTDADLLPTRPPPKAYQASGEPEFALLLSPGRGKGCNLKKFPNLRKFLKEDAKYYPNLIVDYAIAADPKLKFYDTKARRDAGLIHGEFMSEDDLIALLRAGPDESKEPIQSLELSDHDPEPAELRNILAQHKVIRSETPDEDHSAMVIFKAGYVPIDD